MKPYTRDDFSDTNPAWLLFRVDCLLKEQPVDIYMIMDLATGHLTASEITETEFTIEHLDTLLDKAHISSSTKPVRIFIAKGDPAEEIVIALSEKLGIIFESKPAFYFDKIVGPIKNDFSQHFLSPSSMGYQETSNEKERQELACAQKMIPDSYDLCPCASGKKYKFCCKKIFREVVEAMAAYQAGNITHAVQWLNKAKAIVGETPETLCREAIIYSEMDPAKSQQLLTKCLAINPNHPRAHYLLGIELNNKGDYKAAITAYQAAIHHYPQTDHFHLNETYNNLGSVFYRIGDTVNAKSSWEKALLYLPEDEQTKWNLNELIYKKGATV